MSVNSNVNEDLPIPKTYSHNSFLRRHNKGFALALYGLVALLAVVCLFGFFLDLSIGSTNWYLLIAALGLGSAVIVMLVVFLRRVKDDEKSVFLLVAIPLALGFAFFLVPNEVPDEMWHFYRIFDLFSTGNNDMVVPAALSPEFMPSNYRELYSALHTAPDYSSTIVVSRDMSSYLGHMYLFPSLVSMPFQFLGFNPYVVVFIARIANVVMFLVGGYWIIRLMPFGKTLTFIYLVNPILLQQEASCSADAFVNIISLLFIAYFLKLKFQDRIAVSNWIILLLLFIFTALSKYAYAPLILLLLLFVPRIDNKNIRVLIYSVTALFIVLVATYVLFFLSSESHKYALELIRDPKEFVVVYAKSLYTMGGYWVMTFAGGYLGSLDIQTWPIAAWLYLSLLLCAVFNSRDEKCSLQTKDKVFICTLVGILSVVIILVFRDWSVTVDGLTDIIAGVQGRYFIPLLILPLLCGINSKAYIKRPNCLPVYSSLLFAISCIDLLAVVHFFV